MIARGKNASDLFPAVVKNVACKNIEVCNEWTSALLDLLLMLMCLVFIYLNFSFISPELNWNFHSSVFLSLCFVASLPIYLCGNSCTNMQKWDLSVCFPPGEEAGLRLLGALRWGAAGFSSAFNFHVSAGLEGSSAALFSFWLQKETPLLRLDQSIRWKKRSIVCFTILLQMFLIPRGRTLKLEVVRYLWHLWVIGLIKYLCNSCMDWNAVQMLTSESTNDLLSAITAAFPGITAMTKCSLVLPSSLNTFTC